MRQLGEALELARVPCDGAVRSNWPALLGICRRTRAALCIRIVVEPDQPLLTHTHRLYEFTSTGYP